MLYERGRKTYRIQYLDKGVLGRSGAPNQDCLLRQPRLIPVLACSKQQFRPRTSCAD